MRLIHLLWKSLGLACLRSSALVSADNSDPIPSITVQCQDTQLGHWQCGRAIGEQFATRIKEVFAQDRALQALLTAVRETSQGQRVFEAFVHHARQRYPLYMAELNGTSAGAGVSLDAVLVANLRQELTVALTNKDGTEESMTICKNCTDSTGCSADSERITYSPPVGRCYSPSSLWPGDAAWGANDVWDDCTATGLLRRFYASTNGSCVGEPTGHFEVPVNQCVGPFGRPRPWGVFHCSFADIPWSTRMPDACTDLLLRDSSHGVAGWAHNEDFDSLYYNNMYFVRQTVLDGTDEVYSFASFAYPAVLPGWAPGWNSHGIGVSWNVLYPSKILPGPAVAVSFVCRDVLTAKSVEEAIHLASPEDLALGQNLNLGNFRTKLMVTVETAPGGVNDVLKISDGVVTFHANEYLRLHVPQISNHLTSSYHRKRAFERLDKDFHSMRDLLWVLGDTSDTAYPIFRRNDTLMEDTLFTTAFDLNEQTVTIYRGNPRLGEASELWVEHLSFSEEIFV